MTKRVMARVPDEVAEKVVKWAARFGISQAQLLGMSIQAGLDSIIRAVAPAESVPPEILAKIAQALNIDEGVKNEIKANGSDSSSKN